MGSWLGGLGLEDVLYHSQTSPTCGVNYVHKLRALGFRFGYTQFEAQQARILTS